LKKIVIRAARPRDVDDLFAMIRELSAHERARAIFQLTPENLKGVLFGRPKRVYCIVAAVDERLVGYAVWFHCYAFFRGCWVLFLEGLFVHSHYRGRGIGTRLLAHVAKRAIREGCAGILWQARRSNKKAIGFYKALSAKQYLDSCHFVLSDGALHQLAEKAP
jgi:GNAT superfamily N-acetyltransferase